ncbi:protein NDNF-like [Amphiura filiformis]|uniref:protein NDNF-like n=1 Tax=Amphiura filiformis TaxID=82378 RepID=UPI003B2132FF
MTLPSAVSFLLPLVILIVSIITKAQRLPTRDEELFLHQMRNPEAFHLSSLLPDGAEVRVSIAGDNSHMYFFMVEEDSTPVAISVTPCQAQLQWKLSLHELPEDGSGSSEEDQLSEQRPQKKPPNSKLGTVIKTYIGHDVATYLTYNSPAGIYILEVRSPEDYASFRIYSTTTPESDHVYPELPTDPRLDITSAKRNKVSLAWKASPSDTLYGQPIKYCVAMSTRKNYHTWCSVEALVYGEEPDVIPTHSGFGFEGERENRRNLRKRKRKNKKNRDRKARRGENGKEDDNLVVECVGSKTLHTFTNLEPDTKYYFDLFAVHESTNRSATYLGTSIITREKKPKQKTKILKDAKLITSAVRRTQPIKSFTFNVGAEMSDVLITIQPCTWPVTLEVYRAEEQIRSSRVRNLKNFSVKNVEGELTIAVKGVQKRTSHFRLFATTKASKYPFPSLPDDHRIKVFENLRECTSITLAWLTTSEVSQYCLYMRKDLDQSSRQETSAELIETDNYCQAPEMRKKTEKVVCRTVNGADAEMDVLTETVRGLTENTKYVFDVYVSSYGKQTLAYRSAKAKTKKRC